MTFKLLAGVLALACAYNLAFTLPGFAQGNWFNDNPYYVPGNDVWVDSPCGPGGPNRAITECSQMLDEGVYPRERRAQVHTERANAYMQKSEFALALADYNEALELDPNNVWSLIGRARLKAAAPEAGLRDGQQAVSDALKAIELRRNPPSPRGEFDQFDRRYLRAERSVPVAFLDTLAAAVAENGEFESAVELQQKAIASLRDDNRKAVEKYQSRLDLYLRGEPYRYTQENE